MNIEQIAALATSGESETLEFKEATGTRREATMTVCAFLNQGSGQVLFGVTRAGIVVGQQVSERTIEELSAEFRQIDPPAFPTIERVSVDGDRDVIVVSTSQGASRPYTYRGSAYRRVGNTTLAMSADEYNRMLFERSRGRPVACCLLSLITRPSWYLFGESGGRRIDQGSRNSDGNPDSPQVVVFLATIVDVTVGS